MALTRKQKRLSIIAGLAIALALAAALVLNALRDQIVFFYAPAEIAEKGVTPGQPIRVGGLVKSGSCARDGEKLTFVVTDGSEDLTIAYTGLVPDLFREGQGVIAEGALESDGRFTAKTVLAKHDENYIPKELAETLKERGEWYGDNQPVSDPSAPNPCR